MDSSSLLMEPTGTQEAERDFMVTIPVLGISWAENWELDEWIWSRMAHISTPDDNLPFRVRQSMNRNECSLYNLFEDDVRVGFLVVRGEDTLDGKCLHLWVLYHEGRVDPMEAHSEFIDDMAKSIGAKHVTFSTSRLGWIKTGRKYGFRLRELVFQREVM